MALPVGFPAIDFHEFHRETLPALLAGGRHELVARAAAHLGSIAIRLADGAAYTYRRRDAGVGIIPGDETADTVIETDDESWQGLVHELEAPAGLLYAQRVRCARGNAIDLMAWESALRALYNGRPPYDPIHQPLQDRHGSPLDAQASFRLTSDRDEMVHFLDTMGYLLVREVLRPDEVAGLLAEARQLESEARQGDKLSWWGRNAAERRFSVASLAGFQSPVWQRCRPIRACRCSKDWPTRHSSTGEAKAKV